MRSGFDKLAGAYRWMEYLSFGPLLQCCRTQYLPEMTNCRDALILGDGDGRFTASLLEAAPGLRVHAVDVSAAMLAALLQRATCAEAADRVTVTHSDVNKFLPEGPFDLVCTHFFLDCFRQAEVESMVARVRQRMPRGMWVISEFAVPEGAMHGPGALLVRLLYAAFGLLTGLAVRELPRHVPAMEANGFILMQCRPRLFGILRSELWQTEE